MEKYHAMKPTNVRVTVLEDPNSSLQELFNPLSQKQSVPWRERHLPRSFFVPPTETIESSRINRANGSRTTDFVISHNKANSSPASLEPGIESTFSIGNIPNIHVHQKSLDIGMKYPYAFYPNSEFDAIYDDGFLHANSNANTTPYVTRTVLPDAVCDLPPEYDLAINEENKVYFLNHQTQETTWFDPRIPKEYQEWGMTLEQLREAHINYANANVGMHIQTRVERISPGLLPPSGLCTNPASPGLRGQPLPNSSSPSNATGSALSPAIGGVADSISSAVAPTSPSRSLTTSTPVATAPGRMHVTGGKLPTGVAQLPPTHHPRDPAADSQQQMHQHQRQHSHGHSEPQIAVAQNLGSHFRSCSQPVPMSTGCSAVTGSHPGGLPHNPVVVSQSLSSTNGNATTSHLGALATTSSIVGGDARCSLIGGNHVLPGGNLSQHQQQPQQAGVPAASSGQLVQGLEELRLNNPASTLLLEQQQQQQQQQQQHQQQQQQQNNSKHHKTSRGQYILSPTTSTGGQQATSISRYVTPTNTAVAAAVAQHSHQGSMDSGVGQSTASANQTPERGVMVFYDPTGLEEGTMQHMEGITFTADELSSTNYSVFDSIDISQIRS